MRVGGSAPWIRVAPWVVLGVLALLPWVSNKYVTHVAILAGVYVVLATSLDIISGLTGQLALGHAAFFGIGAYTSSLLALNYLPDQWWTFWVGMFLGGVLAAVAGMLVGIPTLRIRGDYLAIVSMGFGEIVRYVLLNWMSVTRGPMGLPGIPAPAIFGHRFGSRTEYYYLVLVLAVLIVVACYHLAESRIGRALIAIREDEVAAEAAGVDTGYYKILAFSLSAGFAGLGGSFFAHYLAFINPSNFTVNESILILSMVVLGGKGTVWGAVLGALVLTSIPEVLRSVAHYRMLLYGLALVIMTIARPDGLWGAAGYLLHRRSGRTGGGEPREAA